MIKKHMIQQMVKKWRGFFFFFFGNPKYWMMRPCDITVILAANHLPYH